MTRPTDKTQAYNSAVLPDLARGQHWYCALVEVIRMPGSETPFFEEDDRDSALAVLWICLSADSPAEAEVQMSEHVAEMGGVAGSIEEMRRLETPADLPLDEEGGEDQSLREAFSDPELGDEIVWGDVYLFDESIGGAG